MTADLVTWFRACLDEDAELAQQIVDRDAWHGIHVDSATVVATHINRWDPARVLAEVAAKRAILDAMSNWQHEDPDESGYYACPAVRTEPLGDLGPESFGEENCVCGVRARRRQIALLLAAPFASRAGFDPSWLD